jgi:TATA-box binding protein (TBP) (component of TFIID and TFIIIB)
MEDSVTSRDRYEPGSISGFVVILSMTFVACAGLAFDGGQMIATRAEATDAAENAARAGVQRVTSLRSGNPTIDIAAAIATANEYLDNIGVSGNAIADQRSVTVTTKFKVKMALLGIFGVQDKSISVVRSAQPFTSP